LQSQESVRSDLNALLRRVSVRALGAGETRETLSRAVLVSAPIAEPAMRNADAIVARRVFEARLRFMIDLPSFFAGSLIFSFLPLTPFPVRLSCQQLSHLFSAA